MYTVSFGQNIDINRSLEKILLEKILLEKILLEKILYSIENSINQLVLGAYLRLSLKNRRKK